MAVSSKAKAPLGTLPLFPQETSEIVWQMSQFSVSELEHLLNVNSKIALQNYHRYQNFYAEDNQALQAILAYTGIVFKRLNPKDFSAADFYYAQDHLRLTSFCYGLLRPLDLIKNYRLEGNVVLPEPGDINLFDFWKPVLTNTFIAEIKKQGGILVNLASSEMKQLFDWKKIETEVQVITPEFRIDKGDQLKTIVVYTKMCRGEMARFILKNRLEDPKDLIHFTFEGFAYRPELSEGNTLLFTLNE